MKPLIEAGLEAPFLQSNPRSGKCIFCPTDVRMPKSYLHDEPGAPFFPDDEKNAKLLYIKEIPLNGSIDIEGNVGFGIGEMILKHAIRV